MRILVITQVSVDWKEIYAVAERSPGVIYALPVYGYFEILQPMLTKQFLLIIESIKYN
jgi:hypothetical protein